MARGKKGSMKSKILTSLGVIIVAITTLWGYNHYMAEQKLNNLYKHGFRLLEEQTALYIKEHYSGVSKIEFSPIFVDGDGRFTVRTAKVVPVVYDNHGNRVLLGRKIGNVIPIGYGLLEGITNLDFDVEGNHVIYLESSTADGEIDVSNYDKLPDEAKFTTAPSIDDNIELLIKNGQLQGVKKDEKGSPDMKIVYNLTIVKGDYTKWD